MSLVNPKGLQNAVMQTVWRQPSRGAVGWPGERQNCLQFMSPGQPDGGDSPFPTPLAGAGKVVRVFFAEKNGLDAGQTSVSPKRLARPRSGCEAVADRRAGGTPKSPLPVCHNRREKGGRWSICRRTDARRG
jgi:hypothetical protein